MRTAMKAILKIALAPVYLLAALLKWIFIFASGILFWPLNALAVILVLGAGISYLTHSCTGYQAISMLIGAFAFFLTAVLSEKVETWLMCLQLSIWDCITGR